MEELKTGLNWFNKLIRTLGILLFIVICLLAIIGIYSLIKYIK